MIRIIIGIILISLFFFSLLDLKEGHLGEDIIRGIIVFLIPGILLTYFGFRSRQKNRLVTKVVIPTEQTAAPIVSERGKQIQPESKASEELIKLAVIGHAEGPGLPVRFIGEDADGHSVNLNEVTQPALLIVPKDTLQHLKQDQGLWRRVKNPWAADDQEYSRRKKNETETGDRLGELLLGPMVDGAFAKDLLPGEFRISVSDTYRDAQLKVAALKFIRRTEK